MDLGLVLWNDCNIACSHCLLESDVKSGEHLEMSDIKKIIESTAKHKDDNWKLSLSGGEPFIYFNKLLEIIKFANERKAKIGVMTNGYWADSMRTTAEKLSLLKSNGLTGLGLSYDGFHSKFIGQEKIENIINVCNDLDVDLTIKSVQSTDIPVSEIIGKLEHLYLSNIKFKILPLYPLGSAGKMENVSIVSKMQAFGKPCPAQAVSVYSNGNISGCCSPGGINISIGNIKDGFDKAHDKLRRNPILSWIRKNSVSDCINFLAEEDRDKLNNYEYVDVCHMCSMIFSNQENKHQIKNAIIKENEKINLSKLFN